MVNPKQTMRALEAPAFSIDALRVVERPIPHPRHGEILVRVKAASLNYRDLAMNRAIARHQLRPVIDSTFPLERAAEAFKRMERGDHFGKIVVVIE